VSAPGAIDVHAHHVPPGYRAALLASGHDRPDGFPQIPEWSAEEHVAVMDRLGIATSLLSISSPGVHLVDGDHAAARALAREVNEAGRRAVVDHPGRFGLLAALPLPDVDGALAEIAHGCAHLDVDGFAVLTNVGGTYLGDPALAPVFRELDRRRARLFVHPTSPACWEHTSLGRPRPMLEFFFDTTRAVVDLVLSGVVAAHPGIDFLIPHAGATLPLVADRVSAFSRMLAVDPAVDVLRDLGRLHFDLAGFPVPRQLDALLTLTTLDHLHHGSDHPFTPEPVAALAAARLAAAGDPPGSLREVLRANTERLFPALAERHRPPPGGASDPTAP
jgi:predicted TIM-barrel fold metal-dependent hydrolase